MDKLSIIIPVYQNELNLPHTYQALREVLESHKDLFDYELIFIDDGSRDRSFEELMKIYTQEKDRVTLIKFTRNFGQVSAWLAGLSKASGNCIAVISADLQDPPSLLLDMFTEWKNNHKIVLAVREAREDGLFVKVTSRLFYGFMRRYSIGNMPKEGYDYFLIDKKVKDILLKMDERNSFFQGQILWTGYLPKLIYYKRRKRELGKSQWTMFKKIKYFIDGFAGYSFFPIRLISFTGIGVFFLGIILTAVLILQRIFYGTHLMGWTSIMIVLLLLSGFQMLMLGVIGEYLWRNFDETRKRPVYIIERIIGKEPSDSSY